jgi:tetrahydrodipicolinate N-succinyltransferase
VGQALEDGEALVDDVVVGTAVEVGHHAHTAGVVLVRGVVEAGGHRSSFRIGEN